MDTSSFGTFFFYISDQRNRCKKNKNPTPALMFAGEPIINLHSPSLLAVTFGVLSGFCFSPRKDWLITPHLISHDEVRCLFFFCTHHIILIFIWISISYSCLVHTERRVSATMSGGGGLLSQAGVLHRNARNNHWRKINRSS